MDELFDFAENQVFQDHEDLSEISPTRKEEEEFCEYDLLLMIKKGVNRSEDVIIKLLKELNLAQNIFTQTLIYFRASIKMEEMKRFKLRASIMCACVLLAHETLGVVVDEKVLISHFKINIKKLTSSMKIIKMRVATLRDSMKNKNSDIFILCQKLKLEKDFDSILEFIELHEKTNNEQKCFKFALLYSWLVLNKDYIPSLASFSQVCEMSHSSIKRGVSCYRQIIIDYFKIKREETFEAFKNELVAKTKISKEMIDDVIIKNQFLSINKIFC